MSDEKDPVRVGRFEWERLMLMSVPHPTNFKLLPIGVFMSADGGRVRPGNAGLAQFGPHEKTWAKLLRWAVAEGWLIQVARGGARRGPNGTTIVRASVYAASVPQPVWERRMEILGAPPFRAAGVEGSAPDSLKGAPGDSPEGLKGASDGSPIDPDSLKGAPETPFNAPDSSLKGASGDSLPDPLKGASGVFEGSDPGFEGSDPSFEGSAQTLPHHVVLSSRSDSSSTSSTTVVAEDVPEASAEPTDGGGGGGDLDSEEQDTNDTRAAAFVAKLDYRGKPVDKMQQKQLRTLVAAALTAGWSERGLTRYLDVSDDPKVRNPASVYLHRLNPDRLPDAGEAEPAEPTGGRVLPPVCDECVRLNPAARYNVRFRTDSMSFQPGALCPRCHPDMVASTGARANGHTADDYANSTVDDLYGPRAGAKSKQQQETDDMFDRAFARAQKRMETGNWAGTGPDERVAGWGHVARQLSASSPQPQIASGSYEPWRDPPDDSGYDKGWPDPEPADDNRYEKDL